MSSCNIYIDQINWTFLCSCQNTVIDPKNELTYTMWRDVPVPFFMSVYFFHVLNPAEILKGEKPMVEQRGPYVYRYVWPQLEQAEASETLIWTAAEGHYFKILIEAVQV